MIDGARLGSKQSSNLCDDGSIPSAPAIYIDDATGREITESWWPGDPLP